MTTLRIFLAHPKNVEDSDIEALVARAKAAVEGVLARLAPDVKVEIVTGRDDFMARAVSEGGWEGWCASVARGTAYRENTLQQRFDAIIVCPSPMLGRGTAVIVSQALQTKKPVYFLRQNGALLTVVNLVEHDTNDWQNGWGIEVTNSG